MQHMKNTNNLGEFQKFIDSDNKTSQCLDYIKKNATEQESEIQFEYPLPITIG